MREIKTPAKKVHMSVQFRQEGFSMLELLESFPEFISCLSRRTSSNIILASSYSSSLCDSNASRAASTSASVLDRSDNSKINDETAI